MKNDPVEIAKRLLAMQKSLSSSLEWIDTVAATSQAAGANGLAFASHMLSEALVVWRNEMTGYMAKYIKEAMNEKGSN